MKNPRTAMYAFVVQSITGAKVFKLGRHLRKNNLNDEQNKLSYKISNVYARNNNGSEEKINEHLEDLKNVELNYKFCVIWKSLIINLCDHLRTTHGLLKDDEAYLNAMPSVTVIPVCAVKKIGKANKLTSVSEVQNLKIHGSKITFPQSLLENLSMIRKEMDHTTPTKLVTHTHHHGFFSKSKKKMFLKYRLNRK